MDDAAVKTDTVKRAIFEFKRGERGVSIHYISSDGLRVKFSLMVRLAEDDARETAVGSSEI